MSEWGIYMENGGVSGKVIEVWLLKEEDDWVE